MPRTRTADLLIVNASELVTMAGRRKPRQREDMANVHAIAEGAVAIGDGRILACARTPDILSKFEMKKGKPLDARGKTVVPGLVDPHTHIVFAGSRENELVMKLEGRTYMEILASGGGIQRTVRATRAASDRELLRGALDRLGRMLLHGTTTIEAKSGYGLELDTEMRMLIAMEMAGMRQPVDVVRTFLGAHAVPPEYRGRPEDYVDFLIRTALPEVVRLRLAEFCDVFCEEGVFTVAQSRKLLLAAKKMGLGLKLHADEIVRTRGAELAAEVGAVSADHLYRSSKEGLERMKEAGVVGVLLPGSCLSLLQRDYPDARMMVSMGLPVALGTDLNPNCLTESMPFIMALACYKLKLTPSEALTAATINAACAIGRQHEIGSLEPGKKADIAIFDAPNHLHIPYHFGVNLVDTVVKDGQVVVRNGARVAKV